MNGLGPKYISDLLVQYETSRCLRSSGGDLLRVPGVRNKQGEATFSYYAPLVEHVSWTHEEGCHT